MATTANSTINIADLDFDLIKSSLKSYLQNQTQFTDYNFDGSVISKVLDLLAYNTHYNSFYLNMVANEMFLDTALKRSSVISHAKLLNYTPYSAACSKALIDITFNGVGLNSSFTIPKYTKFYSKALDGINFPFVTADSYTVNTNVLGNAVFKNIAIHQGQPVTYSYTVNSVSYPQTFKLPDSNIDTNTIIVNVFDSSTSLISTVYTRADELLSLDGNSTVYFLQESLDGFYEIYFGDNVLGKQLLNNNVVSISYLITDSYKGNSISSFTLMDNIGNYSSVNMTTTQPSSGGRIKESIDSIKYQAPKSFSAQNRAVTKEDYITKIQQNKLGYTFDAVNVWGGEQNIPPVYGQVFVCIKPTGGYLLTDTQKQKLIENVIKPISVMTVEPTIVDPDYTYVKLNITVVYDPKLTSLTSAQIQSSVKTSVLNFVNSTLNTFNSTFMSSELNSVILNTDNSIMTNEIGIQLQKKFSPNLTNPSTYNLYFGAPLKKGLFSEGVASSPGMQFRDKINLSTIIDGIYLEEVPSYTVGIESISIINPGFGYQTAPTVTILGDGTGATAEAIMTASGSIRTINITNAGSGYTSAIVKISPANNDTTGQLGAAVANLQGRYGTLRLYYNNTENVKTVYSNNIGTIDYLTGTVTLNSFAPIDIDDPLGQLTITTTPTTSIFSSSYNRIITLDLFDSNAITVNVLTKT
jgi:hypothetical protein